MYGIYIASLARLTAERDALREDVARLEKESEGRRRVLFEKSEDLQVEWQRVENAESMLSAIATALGISPESTGAEVLERAREAGKIGADIQSIMATYREQEASRYGVGTPGGLEHMGDVWNLLSRWDSALDAASSEGGAK